MKFIVRKLDARGRLLSETSHATEASAAVEIEAAQERMKRTGDPMARAELIDCRLGGRLTNTAVYAHTLIGWSWLPR